VLTELGGFPGVSWDHIDPAAAREVQGRHPGLDPGLPGRRLGKGDQRELVPRRRAQRGPQRDRPASQRHRRHEARAGWHIGLLLVAAPVLLVFWLIIYPIISAIIRTLWVPTEGGGTAFSLETYQSSSSPTATASTTSASRCGPRGVCAMLLLLVCLPIALYLRFSTSRSRPMCRASRSSRCSCPRSS
jgi:hypothetical protein